MKTSNQCEDLESIWKWERINHSIKKWINSNTVRHWNGEEHQMKQTQLSHQSAIWQNYQYWRSEGDPLTSYHVWNPSVLQRQDQQCWRPPWNLYTAPCQQCKRWISSNGWWWSNTNLCQTFFRPHWRVFSFIWTTSSNNNDDSKGAGSGDIHPWQSSWWWFPHHASYL